MIFGKKEEHELEAVMKFIPVRAPKVEAEKNGDETVITVRRADTLRAKVLAWFFVIPERKRFTFDKRGTAVWELCDGRRNLEEVIRKFGEAEKLEKERAQPAVLQFLSTLSGRRLISFMPPGVGAGRQDGIE